MSFYTKILTITLLLTFGVTILTITIYIIHNISQDQNLISLLSEIANESSEISAGVLDKNHKLITEKLNKLRRNPDILTVDVHLSKDHASNERFGVEKATNLTADGKNRIYNQEKYLSLFDTDFEITLPIIKENKSIGKIYIKAIDRNPYTDSFFLMTALTTLIAIFMAMYLSNMITEPLISLVNAIKTITTDQNYSVRVKEKGGTEITTLMTAFNGMLDTIQHNEKIQQESLAEIQRLSYYDPLTGLPNRDLFKVYLQNSLTDAKKNSLLVSILYLDLDHFKNINARFSHNSADIFVQEISKKLNQYLNELGGLSSENKNLITSLSRLNGDEFIICLKNVRSIEEVESIAAQILSFVNQPYHFHESQFLSTASIGIAVYPYHGETAETLIKNAATAAYISKDEGKGNYKIFDTKVGKKIDNQIKFENDLYKALERHELVLHYQPKYHLQSKRIISLEALLRWNHPKIGLVPPDEFIPLAENMGLIIDIGAWVIKESCQQCQKWHNTGFPELRVDVNVSARQFLDAELDFKVKSALTESHLAPHFLELEITESAIMINDDQTLATLQALKSIGVSISVDDFGTGYSSLRYLIKYPLNTVKIDKSFIAYILENQSSATIAKAIINLAHNLNLTVVAEGVETIAQLNYLRSVGCDIIQGYYISRPLPAEELTAFLTNHSTKPFET